MHWSLIKIKLMLILLPVFFVSAPVMICLAGEGVVSDRREFFQSGIDLSLLLEARSSMRRGGSYLLRHQLENGSWAHHPVITSLAVLALANTEYHEQPAYRRALLAGADYIRSQVQDDGGIWNEQTRQYPLYSTAISMYGLVRMGRLEDQPVLRRARQRLLAAQLLDLPPESPQFGGFAAPGKGLPSLTMTQWVLEALFLTDYLEAANDGAGSSVAAAYEKARQFVLRCQYSPLAENQETGGAVDPSGLRGSFADYPVPPLAGKWVQMPGTPRSRAFLTCAGLKCLLYARTPRESPPVLAALDWLRANYDVESNPGLGNAGYYTYLFSLTQALIAWADARIQLLPDDRQPRRWREDVVLALLRRQQGDGSWRQAKAADWWENHPELVTSYAMLMLEMTCGPRVQKSQD